MGYNLLEPILETGLRVVGEGFDKVGGLGIRHGWWDGWLDGCVETSNFDC